MNRTTTVFDSQDKVRLDAIANGFSKQFGVSKKLARRLVIKANGNYAKAFDLLVRELKEGN